MSTQQLIYETAVPVSSTRHGKAAVEPTHNYAYARGLNSVPLMAVEFPQAAAHYAIVFAVSGEQVLPVVILGARKGENLYLDANHQWQGQYVPAFLRRYPFVFSTSDDGQTFTLCVDEAYTGLNFQGRGQALFTEDAKPSEYTENVLKFLQEYRAQFMRTQAFCSKLKELNLLEPMQAQFSLATGEKMSLSGFMVIDRAKLKALSGEVLAELAKTDELELIYLHLHSMHNFTTLKDKLVLSQLAQSGAPLVENAAAPAPAAPAEAAKAKAGGGKKSAPALE